MTNNRYGAHADRALALSILFWRNIWRRQKIVVMASGAGATIMAGLGIWWVLSGPEYTVAECLTGIQIHYPADTPERRKDVILKEILDFGGTYIFRDGGPAFSAAVDDNDSGRWYFLYRDDCEIKHDLAQAFVDAYLQAHPATSVEIEVIREPVRPTRYNAAYGDAWIDGNKERPVE